MKSGEIHSKMLKFYKILNFLQKSRKLFKIWKKIGSNYWKLCSNFFEKNLENYSNFVKNYENSINLNFTIKIDKISQLYVEIVKILEI